MPKHRCKDGTDRLVLLRLAKFSTRTASLTSPWSYQTTPSARAFIAPSAFASRGGNFPLEKPLRGAARLQALVQPARSLLQFDGFGFLPGLGLNAIALPIAYQCLLSCQLQPNCTPSVVGPEHHPQPFAPRLLRCRD